MSLRAQGGYLIQSHCQKNGLFFFLDCASQNGVLLNSSLVVRKNIYLRIFSLCYTFCFRTHIELDNETKNFVSDCLMPLSSHCCTYLESRHQLYIILFSSFYILPPEMSFLAASVISGWCHNHVLCPAPSPSPIHHLVRLSLLFRLNAFSFSSVCTQTSCWTWWHT